MMKYSKVKSNALAPVSLDPVLQHMSAWHLRQHEQLIKTARPRESTHSNPARRARRPVTQQSPCAAWDKKSGKWSAHLTSHAKLEVTPHPGRPFQPQILDTGVQSRLRGSRNYQQPRGRSPVVRLAPPVQVAEARSKAWCPAPSSGTSPTSSPSSSGDSAYEAGGSSPQSRGSTPHLQSRPSSEQHSVTSVASGSLPIPCRASQLELSSAKEPRTRPVPTAEVTIKESAPLGRNLELECALFEHELLEHILTAGIVTNAAVKHACRTHLAANHGRLPQEQMEEMLSRLQQSLGIPVQDSMDGAHFGLGGPLEAASTPLRNHSSDLESTLIPLDLGGALQPTLTQANETSKVVMKSPPHSARQSPSTHSPNPTLCDSQEAPKSPQELFSDGQQEQAKGQDDDQDGREEYDETFSDGSATS